MRLLKLIAYSLLGYVLYELWRGIRESAEPSRAGARGSSDIGADERQSDLDRALNQDVGRMMNMTGAGRGTTVTTEDASPGHRCRTWSVAE